MEILEVIFVVCFLVAMGVVFGVRFRAREEQQRRARKTWRLVAKELGGHFARATGFWLTAKPNTLTAHVRGIGVKLDHYETGGENGVICTRVVAAARAPKNFRLKVSKVGTFSAIGRSLGFQDVPVGDAKFDENFIVESSDPEAAKLWLNRAVRNKLCALSNATFLLEGGQLTVRVGKYLVWPSEVRAIIDAAVAMADGRQRLMGAWKKIAKAYGGKVKREPERWASMDLELEGVPIVVDTKKVGKRHYTFTHVKVLGTQQEPFVLAKNPRLYKGTLPKVPAYGIPASYEMWAEHPEVSLGRLNAQVRELIEQVKPAKVRAERDYVEVTWEGVSMSRQEIVRGMRLAAVLASGPRRGPYR